METVHHTSHTEIQKSRSTRLLEFSRSAIEAARLLRIQANVNRLRDSDLGQSISKRTGSTYIGFRRHGAVAIELTTVQILGDDDEIQTVVIAQWDEESDLLETVHADRQRYSSGRQGDKLSWEYGSPDVRLDTLDTKTVLEELRFGAKNLIGRR